MIHTLRHAPAQSFGIGIHQDEIDVRIGFAQPVAITALQRRTTDHAALARCQLKLDPSRHRVEPRRAIGVVERVPGLHLRDISRRVKVIAFLERAIEPLGKRLPDTGIAGRGDAHDDDYVWFAGIAASHWVLFVAGDEYALSAMSRLMLADKDHRCPPGLKHR